MFVPPQDKRAATVRAVSDVSVLALHAAAFAELLGPLVPLMREQSHAYAATMRLGQQPQMKDIKILATLGTGGFGQVHLVRHQGRCLALKCMNKRFIIEHGLLEHVLRERALMLGCSCPWIVNLDATLQDEKHVYWLMEACMGGELFAYMQALQRPMAEAQARFYAASVVLALEYLHGQGLVYRDLKPENLLLDSQVSRFSAPRPTTPHLHTPLSLHCAIHS